MEYNKNIWRDLRMLTYSGIGRYLQGLLKSGLFWRHPYEVNILSLVKDKKYIKKNISYGVGKKKINGVVSKVKLSFLRPYNPLEHFLFFFSSTRKSFLHCPHYNAPLFWRGKLIITIHDIAHIDCPEASPGWIKKKYAKFLIKTMAERASKIITNSFFTKSRLEEVLKIDKKKIEVVYFGPGLFGGFDKDFFPFINLMKEKDIFYNEPDLNLINSEKKLSQKSIKNKVIEIINIYQKKIIIKKPYILFVGNFKPHKNIPRLIQAFENLIKKYNSNSSCSLVLVGKKSGLISPDKNIKKLLSRLIGKNKVIITDLINDASLCNLYKNANLLVQPSLYEGFGFPPIEALSFGVPVVSSNRASLPEILGDSALYFDPYNIDEMTAVIEKGLSDNQLRKRLTEKGKERIKKYSWHQCAKEHAKIYREVCEF